MTARRASSTASKSLGQRHCLGASQDVSPHRGSALLARIDPQYREALLTLLRKPSFRRWQTRFAALHIRLASTKRHNNSSLPEIARMVEVTAWRNTSVVSSIECYSGALSALIENDTSARFRQLRPHAPLIVLGNDRSLGFIALVQKRQSERKSKIVEQCRIFGPHNDGSGRHDDADVTVDKPLPRECRNRHHETASFGPCQGASPRRY